MSTKNLTLGDCKKCNGTGKTPLPGTLKRTIALFRRNPRKALTAHDIFNLLGELEAKTPNNISNRLARLEAAGLIVAQPRKGKFVPFKLKAKP